MSVSVRVTPDHSTVVLFPEAFEQYSRKTVSYFTQNNTLHMTLHNVKKVVFLSLSQGAELERDALYIQKALTDMEDTKQLFKVSRVS